MRTEIANILIENAMKDRSKVRVDVIRRTVVYYAPYSWLLSWFLWPIVIILNIRKHEF